MEANTISNYVVMGIAFLEVLIAVYVLTRQPASLVKNAVGLMTISVALWLFSGGYGSVISDLNSVLFWWKVTFLGATGIAAFFLLFSWVFPFQREEIKTVHYVVVILPIIFFGLLLFFTNSFVSGLDTSGKLPVLTFNFGHRIFGLYFLGYWIWALGILTKKYRISDGLHRWQLKLMLWGTIISSAIAITTNLILGLFDSSYYKTYDWSNVGYIASVIWLGFVSYLIFKKK